MRAPPERCGGCAPAGARAAGCCGAATATSNAPEAAYTRVSRPNARYSGEVTIVQYAADARVPRAHPLDVRDHVLRLYASTRLHRLVPDRVALALAAGVGRARWLWPPARRRAIGRVSLTVAGTGREGEVRSLARKELLVGALRTERMWRPWLDD